jgi:hypothetical protein
MPYVPVPKDLTKVKTKVMFNLTKRQLLCFSLAALAGVPLFFLLKAYTSVSVAALVMVIAMLPFFLFALYEKNGQPLEVFIRHIVQVRFVHPKHRPYKTDNFYAAINRQIQLDREVRAIVTRKEKTGHAH